MWMIFPVVSHVLKMNKVQRAADAGYGRSPMATACLHDLFSLFGGVCVAEGSGSREGREG